MTRNLPSSVLIALAMASPARAGAQESCSQLTRAEQHVVQGATHAEGGRFDAAAEAFAAADRLCDVEISGSYDARRDAAEAAYEAGLAAFGAGEEALAVARWRAAVELSEEHFPARFNLGVVFHREGRVAEAAEAYRAVVEVIDSTVAAGPAEREIRATSRNSALGGLLAAGAANFQAERFAEALEIFTFVTEVDPWNRDAWYNRALALYKMERWLELVTASERVVQVDPLNYNARIVLFNAYKALAEGGAVGAEAERARALALETLEGADALPVQVEGITVDNHEDGTSTVTGTVLPGTAPPGTALRLGFTLYGVDGTQHAREVTVRAPAANGRETFTLDVAAGAVGSFSYVLR